MTEGSSTASSSLRQDICQVTPQSRTFSIPNVLDCCKQKRIKMKHSCCKLYRDLCICSATYNSFNLSLLLFTFPLPSPPLPSRQSRPSMGLFFPLRLWSTEVCMPDKASLPKTLSSFQGWLTRGVTSLWSGGSCPRPMPKMPFLFQMKVCSI